MTGGQRQQQSCDFQNRTGTQSGIRLKLNLSHSCHKAARVSAGDGSATTVGRWPSRPAYPKSEARRVALSMNLGCGRKLLRSEGKRFICWLPYTRQLM